jgi:hypothetical protein
VLKLSPQRSKCQNHLQPLNGGGAKPWHQTTAVNGRQPCSPPPRPLGLAWGGISLTTPPCYHLCPRDKRTQHTQHTRKSQCCCGSLKLVPKLFAQRTPQTGKKECGHRSTTRFTTLGSPCSPSKPVVFVLVHIGETTNRTRTPMEALGSCDNRVPCRTCLRSDHAI